MNPGIIGLYIGNPETGEENYYPISGGSSNVQLVNRRAVIYFVDSSEQRYVTGIKYEVRSFLKPEQMPGEWILHNLSNSKILQNLSDKVDGPVTARELPVLRNIAFNEDYLPWMQSRALEKLLKYYEDHQDKKELARWLEKKYPSERPITFTSDYKKVSLMKEDILYVESDEKKEGKR